jgi:hypothetical protein
MSLQVSPTPLAVGRVISILQQHQGFGAPGIGSSLGAAAADAAV